MGKNHASKINLLSLQHQCAMCAVCLIVIAFRVSFGDNLHRKESKQQWKRKELDLLATTSQDDIPEPLLHVILATMWLFEAPVDMTSAEGCTPKWLSSTEPLCRLGGQVQLLNTGMQRQSYHYLAQSLRGVVHVVLPFCLGLGVPGLCDEIHRR